MLRELESNLVAQSSGAEHLGLVDLDELLLCFVFRCSLLLQAVLPGDPPLPRVVAGHSVVQDRAIGRLGLHKNVKELENDVNDGADNGNLDCLLRDPKLLPFIQPAQFIEPMPEINLKEYLRHRFELELQYGPLTPESFDLHVRHIEQLLEHRILRALKALQHVLANFEKGEKKEHRVDHHRDAHEYQIKGNEQRQHGGKNRQAVHDLAEVRLAAALESIVDHLDLMVNQTSVNSVVRADHREQREGEPRRVRGMSQASENQEVGNEVQERGDFDEDCE